MLIGLLFSMLRLVSLLISKKDSDEIEHFLFLSINGLNQLEVELNFSFASFL